MGLATIRKHRAQWIETGFKWFQSEAAVPKPSNWDPVKQLLNIPKEYR
ncbi:MAG: hypothetical protein KC476_03265 [Cyanobacteria bacterium HKST-UBA06]|nr:hypothetical protein [Cyanobacteria bacterium HKST-UBA06]